MEQTGTDTVYNEERILTIPNAMSLFRLILIPLIVWLYAVRKQFIASFGLLALSGVTDVLDGFVARKFHMVSKLGKVLDPIADKLTQAALLVCIILERHYIAFLFVTMFIKEMIMIVCGMAVIKKTGEPYSAKWHGKLTTFLLDLTVVLHVLWRGIPDQLSIALVILCAVVMLYSLIEYLKEDKRLTHDC
ncbi:MAG: CDP-alcohol phosphatidyltransferase family protein [Lachnospiraceae bacterium]|nr:CDP-alcohol phosphatidyltransferase family protein [Lachnospiraceae bacterium]